MNNCKKEDCVLLKMNVNWMGTMDGEKCMPYILGASVDDNNLYRVNFCPSCGENVRNIIIKE